MTPGDYHIILMQIVFRVCVCGPWTVVRKLKEKKQMMRAGHRWGSVLKYCYGQTNISHNYCNFELGVIFACVHWILRKDFRKYFRMTIFPIFFFFLSFLQSLVFVFGFLELCRYGKKLSDTNYIFPQKFFCASKAVAASNKQITVNIKRDDTNSYTCP